MDSAYCSQVYFNGRTVVLDCILVHLITVSVFSNCFPKICFFFSLHQHMKRVSASLWSCHTTSSHLVWTSRLLRASTTTRGLMHLNPSALTPTALFYLCDADQVLQRHDGGERHLIALHRWMDSPKEYECQR